MAGFRFATWNWNVFNPGRIVDKLALLEPLQPDVVALQEVSRPTAAALRQHFPGCAVIEGLFRSEWASARANGAALLIRDGLEVVDSTLPALSGWEGTPGPSDAVPPPESFVAAQVLIDGKAIAVASGHPPNAAGRGDERDWRVARKIRTYAAIESWVRGKDPLVLGMDANAWIDTVGSPFEPPVFDDDPQRPIMEFFRAQPSSHGLRDAFPSWLSDHPEALAEIQSRRPNGPLATTYVRGGTSRCPTGSTS